MVAYNFFFFILDEAGSDQPGPAAYVLGVIILLSMYTVVSLAFLIRISLQPVKRFRIRYRFRDDKEENNFDDIQINEQQKHACINSHEISTERWNDASPEEHKSLLQNIHLVDEKLEMIKINTKYKENQQSVKLSTRETAADVHNIVSQHCQYDRMTVI